MKTIVITGSTRGIGFGLADSFLALGCRAVVSGRQRAAVDEAVAELAARHEAERVFGQPCDVTRFDQVQALWDAAQARFGAVDVWINNAGRSHLPMPFHRLAPELVESVLGTNVLGTMYGSRVAIAGMLDQGFGQIYNMEGMGSDGHTQEGLTLYGSTKYGLRYLNKALVKELKGTPVLFGMLSPGMVLTALVTDAFEEHLEAFERARFILNILTDRVETVTPWLARKILENEKHGVQIQWLSFPKLLGRFLTAPFKKRDVFGDWPPAQDRG